jgi:hypothetical protein
LRDEPRQRLRHIVTELRERRRCLFVVPGRGRPPADERQAAGEHLVEDDAQAVDVGARVGVLAGVPFGGGVGRGRAVSPPGGAHAASVPGPRLPQQAGEAEGDDLRLQPLVVVTRQDDVRRLQPAVDDAAAVRGL